MPADPAQSLPRSQGAPRIPGYEIESVIGRGATGVVYRARQVAIDREVALKVIHPELAAKPRTIQRLQREARTTARLAHPNIVSAIDMGETNGTWWFAMELVDGPSLALRLRQEGRLPERECLRLFIQLAEALVHMHEHAVVHRDIKPANILIDKNGARLADLGLAFAETDPSLTGSEGTLGTPHYMSPEQSKDPSSVGIQSDLWSFGATLFHAACGRPPFAGQSLAEVLSGVLYAPIPDPQELEPELSSGLALVIRKCLVRDCEQRYQTPRELLADLERVRERRRPKVRSAALDRMEGSWPPAVRAGVAAGLVALALIGVWAITGRAPWPAHAARDARLDALSAAVAQGGVELAGAYGELARPPTDLPLELRDRWEALRGQARGDLREELRRIARELEAEIEPLLARGECVSAQRALADGLAAQLPARTGFALGALPAELAHELDAPAQAIRARVAELFAGAKLALESRLQRDILPQADELISQQRWRDALHVLGQRASDLGREAGLALDGLPDAERAALDEVIAPRLAERSRSVRESWAQLDAQLADWVDQRFEELEGDLDDLRVEGAASRLRTEFAERRAAYGILSEQVPLVADQLVPSQADQRLEVRCFDLRERENDLRSRRALSDRRALGRLLGWLDEGRLAQHWQRRELEPVIAYWEARVQELSVPAEPGADPAGSSPSVQRSLLELALARRDEALLVRDLLRRAAAGALASDGAERTLKVGTLGFRGVLRAGRDPLGLGVDFLPTAGGGPPDGYHLWIAAASPASEAPADRRLQAGDLLALALDAAALGEAASPRERDDSVLAAAALSAREGEPQLAKAALAEYQSGQREVLANDLRRRVDDSIEQRGRDLAELTREADRQLQQCEDALRAGGDLEALRRGLLSFIGGLGANPGLSRQLASARAMLANLDSANALRARPLSESEWRAEVHSRFGASDTSYPAEGRARLTFRFQGSSAGAFAPGSWVPDGLGWAPLEGARRIEDVLTREGPRLELGELFDLETGALEVTFEIAQPEGARPRLTILCAGGLCLALTGDGLPGRRTPGYVLVAGGPELALAKVQAGEIKALGHGLEPGSTHQIKLEIARAQNRAIVEMDGARVVRASPAFTRSAPAELRLYAWEPVRLQAVAVQGQRR